MTSEMGVWIRIHHFDELTLLERRVEVCATYLQIAAFRQYARDRRFLAQQLQSFSVQHALCRLAAAPVRDAGCCVRNVRNNVRGGK